MKQFKLPLSFLLLTGAMNVFAQGVLTSNCPVATKIRLPDNSSGFYMSEDCKTAYILPPSKGSIELQGITESASLDRCRELDIIQKELKVITEKLLKGPQEKKEPQTTGYNPHRPLPVPGRSVEQEEPQEMTDEEMMKLLTEKHKLGEEMIKKFGQVPGAVVSMMYSTGYDKLLKNFQEMNKGLPVRFAVMPLKKTKLSFSTPVLKGSEYPIALSSDFSADENESISSSVSGYVELSLLGACSLRDKFMNMIPRNITARKFSSLLIAQMSYEYELLSTVKYEASFNRGGLAKRIRDVSTKGGFFKTSSVSSLVNTSKTDSYFKYTAYCDEGRACEELHKVNIVDIKKRLIDDVLANILLVKFEYPLAPEGASSPGQNGAGAAAQQLKNCQHKYCQIASGVLDVASAMGSTSKVDKFINSESHWAQESATTRKPYSYQGSMSFGPER